MDTLKLWRGSGKAAARRTGPNDVFHIVWAIQWVFFISSNRVSYILTIIEMLCRLQLYRGTVRRLRKGKRAQTTCLTLFRPSVSSFFLCFYFYFLFFIFFSILNLFYRFYWYCGGTKGAIAGYDRKNKPKQRKSRRLGHGCIFLKLFVFFCLY